MERALRTGLAAGAVPLGRSIVQQAAAELISNQNIFSAAFMTMYLPGQTDAHLT
jgi:hypothetical protein